MPYCQQCGGAVAESAHFCTRCGVAITPSQTDSPPARSDQQRQSSQGKKPLLKWAGIGCGGLLGLFILAAIIAVIASPDAGQEAPEPPVSSLATTETEKRLPEYTVFDHSQDREDLFYAYVPAETAGYDGDVYAVAVSEYRKRNEERVNGSFFTDPNEAEEASCFEEPNSAGFSIPCDRKFSEHYPSHWGTVTLEQDSRYIDKRLPSVEALETDLSNWDSTENIPAYEVVAEDLSLETRNSYVLVSGDTGASNADLCAITKSVYQETGNSVNLFQIFFLTSDSQLVKQARENDRQAVSQLVTESIASLSISPNPTSATTIPDPIKPYRSFRRRGAWDENSPVPTCRSNRPPMPATNSGSSNQPTEVDAESTSGAGSRLEPAEPVSAPAFNVEGYVIGDSFSKEVCQEFHAWIHRGGDFGNDGSVTLYGHILVADPFHKVLIHLGGSQPKDVWGAAEREVHAGAVEMRENFLEVQAVTGVAGDIPRWAILYQTCKERFRIDPFESVPINRTERVEPVPPRQPAR